ncbi:YxeA family protein [Sporosarcina contaminans]|uniref:YxeA family protein n=1 Tax=Sporosarcina contaminans TaxID=633403 RepID=A0ABW3U0X0_9BACL
MKKLKKLLLSTLGMVVIGIGALALIGEENRDRFNPFIQEKDVYVLVDKEGKTDPNFKYRYMFKLDGVEESGEVEEIKITSSVKSFPENSYLKVHVKGKYVYEYEQVTEEDVPEKVKKILGK